MTHAKQKGGLRRGLLLWLLVGYGAGGLSLDVDVVASPGSDPFSHPIRAAQNGIIIDMCEAIDTSGSIDQNELQLQIDGFKATLREVLLPATQDGATINLAIVAFGTNVQTFLDLTPVTAGNLGTIEAAYDAILNTTDRGKTNMGGAINQCAAILQADGNADRQVIDLSTDGKPTIGPNTEQAATAAKNAGIEIWTLGVGSGADNDFLANKVAGCPPAVNCGAQNFPVETFQQFGDAIRQKTQTIIAGPNDPPLAVDDSATTQQNTPVTLRVLDNDSDPNGDPLTVTDVTSPANGTATINPDNTITYTPNTGFVGTDSFTYTISDGRGGTDTARVTVTVVTQLNQPPVAGDDRVTTSVGTPVTIAVLQNDSDPDNDPLQVVRIVNAPLHGTAEVRTDGTIRYSPDPGFLGVDSFTYEVCDNGTPPLCDTATVTVEITPGGVVGIPLLPPLGYLMLALLFSALLLREIQRMHRRTA